MSPCKIDRRIFCTTQNFDITPVTNRFFHLKMEGHIKLSNKAIFHDDVEVIISGGYQDPVYIIGGGTVLYSTHKQRTVVPYNLQAGN